MGEWKERERKKAREKKNKRRGEKEREMVRERDRQTERKEKTMRQTDRRKVRERNRSKIVITSPIVTLASACTDHLEGTTGSSPCETRSRKKTSGPPLGAPPPLPTAQSKGPEPTQPLPTHSHPPEPSNKPLSCPKRGVVVDGSRILAVVASEVVVVVVDKDQRNGRKRTKDQQNGPKRTGTDRNGPKTSRTDQCRRDLTETERYKSTYVIRWTACNNEQLVSPVISRAISSLGSQVR